MKFDPVLAVAKMVLAAPCILVAVLMLQRWLGVPGEAMTVSLAVFSLYLDWAHHRMLKSELDELKCAFRRD